MSTKSKRRIQARRTKQDSTAVRTDAVKVPAEERKAIGAIMGGLLSAITFGAVEPAPQSRAPQS